MDGSEVELKLRADPQDLGRLTASPALAAAKGRPAARTLESTYFDTEDLRLRRQETTLRVRKQGRRFIQTIKAASDHAGGILSRSEWECAVTGPEPDLAAIDDPVALQRLGPVTAAELQPVFTSYIKRSVRVLNGEADTAPDTEIEIAIDSGEIRTPGGVVLPVHEIELELKQGQPKALYDLALALAETAPLYIESRTKAERGYALAAGETESAYRATRLTLSPDATAEEALSAILRNCLTQAARNEACAVAGNDPEGIHQMRVGLRRLRSALGLFRRFVPADQYDELVTEVKWLAGALGPARDWDVFLADLLSPVGEELGDDAHLADLRRAAEASRMRGYEHARAAIQSPRYTKLLLRFGAWLEGRSWRRQDLSEDGVRLFAPVTDLADSLLARRYRQARKRGRRFEHLDPEARHQVRIALKKLRYAAEFFRSLYDDKPATRFIRQLAKLQDGLGHLNDVATARLLLARLDSEGTEGTGWRVGGGMVIGWYARGLLRYEPQLIEEWDQFVAAKPFWSRPAD
jgi:triphosphatase